MKYLLLSVIALQVFSSPELINHWLGKYFNDATAVQFIKHAHYNKEKQDKDFFFFHYSFLLPAVIVCSAKF